MLINKKYSISNLYVFWKTISFIFRLYMNIPYTKTKQHNNNKKSCGDYKFPTYIFQYNNNPFVKFRKKETSKI